ncbi:RNA-binding domain-containing protein [Streptomyces sp. NPDC093084]|uniref:RNA-binding domain-containing protein n=1 Tax=Streptomyces sp. NPDC093084 TaxID=3155197 RepID=UPI00342935C8
MPQMDLEGARASLRADKPTELLELREGQWLDAKTFPYELRDPAAAEELVKDVAAFANGGGGLLVLGVATRLEHGEEVLDRIVPVDRTKIDLDQMRKRIRERITPAPRSVTVGWSDDGQSCVVFIDVPQQAPGTVFVVPAPAAKQGKIPAHTVAVPVRDADGTHWFPRTEIQRLLSMGFTAHGMPGPQALAELVRQAIADNQAHTSPPSLRVGQGLPAREREILHAHEHLRRQADLGQPTSEAYELGACVVQHIADIAESEPGWVLCLVDGQQPLAVAEPVWQAVMDAGRRAPGGGQAISAVGHPAVKDDQPVVLGTASECVDLVGGTWGPGRLVRSGSGPWRWEPHIRLGLDQTRASRNWTANHPAPQLRLRALVNWPWADTGDLEISPSRRRELAQALPISALAGAATLLSQRRGAELRTAQWESGPYRNALDAVSSSSTVTAPDGRPALSATAMAALPNPLEAHVVTCAEVLIEDAATWASCLPADFSTRLSLEEVQAVLLAAWETAADLLPAATTQNPPQMHWAGAPTVELRLSAEGPHDRPQPGLGTMIYLSPLGPTDRSVLSEMAVTITVTPALEHKERQKLLRRAFIYMAHSFGYVEADEDVLL